MVVDYIPLGFDKVDEFFKDTGYENRLEQEEVLMDLVDNRFCRYLYKNGRNAGFICGRKSKIVIKDNCCKQHLKYLYPEFYKEYKKNIESYYVKKTKDNTYYCNSISIRTNKQCGRKVKNPGELCYAHIYKNTVNLNDLIIIFLKLTVFIFIVFVIFVLIINIHQKKEKEIIYFGSLKFKKEIPEEPAIKNNDKKVISLKYKKKINKKFLPSQSLIFSKELINKINTINKYNQIKIGEIKINMINIMINKKILLKIKSLIYFKNLYLKIKDKNNNMVYDEPSEYFIEDTNDCTFQTRRTSSYLFDDINYIQKIYTYFDFLIKSFENKYGPPPNDAKHMINYVLNLFKNPDFNILKIDNIK